MSTEFYWVAVTLVTIVSAARITRLATVDKFPPVKWARDKYEDATDGSNWQWLTMCGYCFGFWAALLVIGWGLLAGVYSPSAYPATEVWTQVWWVGNGLLAAAYLAAVFMAYDGDPNDEDI